MGKKKSNRQRRQTSEVPIIGELFEEQETDIIKSLLEIPIGEEVTFYIDSGGGSVYSAISIASLMRYREIKGTAVVLGECSSSSIMIFAACQRRFVTARSVFLFHRVKWRSEKDVRSEEAAHWVQHFKWLESEADDYQATMLGKPKEIFAKWIEEGKFVLGKDMVELGLAEMIDV